MNYDIFENDKERIEARKSLSELMQHPGWKLIIRALDSNIKYLSDQQKNRIEHTKDFQNLEQLYASQDRIDDLESLKNLPKDILESLVEDFEPEDDDVYDS